VSDPAVEGSKGLDAPRYDVASLPYRLAVLCYLWDEQGRLLLLHRAKAPNAGMHSPIGGKIEIARGETPHECAVREIEEESGVRLHSNEVRLCGMVAERGYEGKHHWLIFLYEATRPIAHAEVPRMTFDEGALEWIDEHSVATIGIPWTDQEILWPAIRSHRGGFFAVDIDCSVQPPRHRIVESWGPAGR